MVYSCPSCDVSMHLFCMAKHCLSHERTAGYNVIPTMGTCPGCHAACTWSEVISNMQYINVITDGHESATIVSTTAEQNNSAAARHDGDQEEFNELLFDNYDEIPAMYTPPEEPSDDDLVPPCPKRTDHVDTFKSPAHKRQHSVIDVDDLSDL